MAEIFSLCSPHFPTAVPNWALDSALFTEFIELVKPKLDICAVSTAVYLRSFLVAGTHLVSVRDSTQWMWSISTTAFTHSCKNPTISFLQTLST